MPKPIPHERKLKELNVVNGLLYAVSIRPVRSMKLSSMDVGSGPDAEGRGLEAQCKHREISGESFVGRHPYRFGQYRTADRELCPESSSSALRVVDGSVPIGELSTLSLEEVFIIVREELEHTQSYEKYKEVINEALPGLTIILSIPIQRF
uniref:Tox-ART-HYD1 domain-containing protein n=1 Tax=Angiostrongylus cantonensis TaxID=6313 RepID=A0A158P8R3_ANGCA